MEPQLTWHLDRRFVTIGGRSPQGFEETNSKLAKLRNQS